MASLLSSVTLCCSAVSTKHSLTSSRSPVDFCCFIGVVSVKMISSISPSASSSCFLLIACVLITSPASAKFLAVSELLLLSACCCSFYSSVLCMRSSRFISRSVSVSTFPDVVLLRQTVSLRLSSRRLYLSRKNFKL